MSNYASLDDVQRRMPQFVLGPATKPNLDTAQVFLEDTHAQFDAAMENLGYVIPITGARSLAQCKEIISQGVICKILHARASAVGTDVAVQSADRACKQYENALKLLADEKSPIELTDAERTRDAVDKPSGTPMGLLYDQDDGERIVPRVYMKQVF
jgi:hypothetical protein